jgi:hypothetical protein
MESITPIQASFADGPHYTIVINGRRVEINQQEVDLNRRIVKSAFRSALRLARDKANLALENYAAVRRFDIFPGVYDPGLLVRANSSRASARATAGEGALNSDQYVTAANALIEADRSASIADRLISAYRNNIVDAGELTVTVLEYVKTACEITLVVGAVVATGGAALAAVGDIAAAGAAEGLAIGAAEVAGATAAEAAAAGAASQAAVAAGAGAEVAAFQAAATFAGRAGIAMTAAEGLGRAASGEEIDWTQFTFELALDIVMNELGPGDKIKDLLLEKLGRQAVQRFGEVMLRQAIANVVAASTEAVLKNSVQRIFQLLRGDDDVTWDKFIDDVKDDFLENMAPKVLEQLGTGAILR